MIIVYLVTKIEPYIISWLWTRDGFLLTSAPQRGIEDLALSVFWL